MDKEPIQIYNRESKCVEVEQVYGEAWLRWVYETPIGRLALLLFVRRAIFSKLMGWRMNMRASSRKILPFVLKYNIDSGEFSKNVLLYRTFNEFFSRGLKKEARPVTPGDHIAILPADGRHLVFPDVSAANGFWVKGRKFSLNELLGSVELARRFENGAMLISRLAPVDYHRFHFPVSGIPSVPQKINGYLYSVNPIALRQNIRYLIENKRSLTLIDSPEFGQVAMVEIGATAVGSIQNLYAEGIRVQKGESKGFFEFGGSCVITLFQKGRIQFSDDLLEQSSMHRETYALMGTPLGEASSSAA